MGGDQPDGRTVAYLWSDGVYGPPLLSDVRPRMRTLEESICLRWYDVAFPSAEHSVLLDTVELPRLARWGGLGYCDPALWHGCACSR